MTRAAALGAMAAAALLTQACGKEGPPLPPLVRSPVAPAGFRAERRADSVDLHFVIPNANTDGSKPADLSRVDVYAITAVGPVSDEQLVRQGTRVGSVEVRPPADEDEAAASTAPVSDAAVADEGVDQGATAHVAEQLTPDLLTSPLPYEAPAPAASGAPLLGAPTGVLARTYGAVGYNRRDRRGPISALAAIPLTSAPAPPPRPEVTYDETRVTISWPPAGGSERAAGPPAAVPVLPSRQWSVAARPSMAYHVYELGQSDDPETARVPKRLTDKPALDATFVDARVEWGVERCYTVTVVTSIGALSVESEPAPARCVTFTDSFAPAAPSGLTAVASGGAISLIWDANLEPDVAGYVVHRRLLPDGASQRVTADLVATTSYRDGSVAVNERYGFTVQAVDKAGNVGALSAAVEETAR